jgi:tryptophanyl-tRNA synthetase
MAEPDRIEQILLEGAIKARAHATPFLARIRDAVGIKQLG